MLCKVHMSDADNSLKLSLCQCFTLSSTTHASRRTSPTCFPQGCACCNPLHMCIYSTYNTWPLINVTPKVVVFSFLFFSTARMHKHAFPLIAGGLAAPALAAVAGSVATTIGGSAAAATAVTGMMGSSVGAASMIAGFGYYGGRVTADHMARRIGIFTHWTPLSLSSPIDACMHAFAQSLIRACVPSSKPSFIGSLVHQLVNLPDFVNPPTHMLWLNLPSPYMHARIESFFGVICQTVIRSSSQTRFLIGLQGLLKCIHTASAVPKQSCLEQSGPTRCS